MTEWKRFPLNIPSNDGTASARYDTGALLATAGVAAGAGTLAYTTLPPLLPHMVRLFNLSTATAGLISASFALGAFVAAAPATRAAVHDVRVGVTVGLWSLAVGTLGFGLASAPWQYALARFVQGAGDSFSYICALTWLFSASPPTKRSGRLGTVSGLSVIGGLIGPLVGALASTSGSRPVFLTVACVIAILAMLAGRSRLERPGPKQPISLLLSIVRTARLPVARPLALQATLSGALAVLGSLRLGHDGFSPPSIAIVFFSSALSLTVAYPLIGWVSDRMGTRQVLVGLLLLATIVSTLLALSRGHWFPAVCVALASLTYSMLAIPSIVRVASAARQSSYSFAISSSVALTFWAAFSAGGAAGGAALAQAAGNAVPLLVAGGLCSVLAVSVARESSPFPRQTL